MRRQAGQGKVWTGASCWFSLLGAMIAVTVTRRIIPLPLSLSHSSRAKSTWYAWRSAAPQTDALGAMVPRVRSGVTCSRECCRVDPQRDVDCGLLPGTGERPTARPTLRTASPMGAGGLRSQHGPQLRHERFVTASLARESDAEGAVRPPPFVIDTPAHAAVAPRPLGNLVEVELGARASFVILALLRHLVGG